MGQPGKFRNQWRDDRLLKRTSRHNHIIRPEQTFIGFDNKSVTRHVPRNSGDVDSTADGGINLLGEFLKTSGDVVFGRKFIAVDIGKFLGRKSVMLGRTVDDE